MAWLVAAGAIVAWAAVAYFVRSVGDFTKRLFLCASAFNFRRSYGAGGIGLLLALVAALGQHWELKLIDWPGLSNDTLVQYGARLALLALVMPVVMAFCSELGFLCTLALTRTRRSPILLPVPIGQTVDRSEVKRNAGQANVTDQGETTRTSSRLLVPMEVPSGGFKAIVRCFVSQAFSSHMLGYKPYGAFSALNPTRRSPGTRIVVLAKDADAADIEHLGQENFQSKRVTDSCRILVREPLTPADRRAFFKEQRALTEKPEGVPGLTY